MRNLMSFIVACMSEIGSAFPPAAAEQSSVVSSCQKFDSHWSLDTSRDACIQKEQNVDVLVSNSQRLNLRFSAGGRLIMSRCGMH